MVELYGKPGCGLCQAAEEKLRRLGVEYVKHDVAPFLSEHEGWRDDDSVAVSSAYYMLDGKLPILRIDGEFFSYPQAMRRLKHGEQT
jgi:glutaredoxin